MMRNIRLFLALGLTLVGLPTGWAQDNSPEVVVVPDATLRAVLEDRLGLAEGAPILATELAELTELEAEVNIADLTGLEFATGLSRLRLGVEFPHSRENAITDLSPVSGLTSLTWLSLSTNEITDVAPLRTLTGLMELRLSHNQITDLSPLASLTALRVLHLSGNRITDLSPLASLTALTELRLYHNQIVDVSPLAPLTNLIWLALSFNQVTDLSPLASLTAPLRGLGLSHNQITDLSPLASLTALTGLDLDDNQITDLSPLASLTALVSLGLRDNRIADLSPLASLTALRRLYVEGNPLSAERRFPRERLVDGPPSLSHLIGEPWRPNRPAPQTLQVFGFPAEPLLHFKLQLLVEAYEAALAAGRVTARVVPGYCPSPYSEPAVVPEDMLTWDPSQPAPSLRVRAITLRREGVHEVARYLEDHGISSRLWEGQSEDGIQGMVWACVPLPLVVPLSEQPAVFSLREVFEARPRGDDTITQLEPASWGRIKSRFQQAR